MMASKGGKANRVEKRMSLKRKGKSYHNSLNSKRDAVLRAVPLESLPWQEVALPERLEDAEGFFGLEEIEDVDVLRDPQSGTVQYRVATNSVKLTGVKPSPERQDDQSDPLNGTEWEGFSDNEKEFPPQKDEKGTKKIGSKASARDSKKLKSSNGQSDKKQSRYGNPFEVLGDSEDEGVDVSAWANLQLSSETLFSLAKLKFWKPTPIQSAAIPKILSGHDVIGKASTGSGKTLAFGIPILEHFLAINSSSDGIPSSKERQFPPIAMILSPTRELAHQLGDHLDGLCSRVGSRSPRIATITGGLSLHKQERLLATADIIIGTPGRLWEIISSMSGLLKWLRQIKFLVVDEADRLLSEGHFKEVEEILNSLDREIAEDDADLEGRPAVAAGRQTLVFSATFEKDLQRKLAGRTKAVDSGPQSKKDSIGYLLEKLNFREKPILVDVNPVSQMAGNLKQGLVECAALEKDLYLYAVLLHYPNARTLVFANSISAVRRIVPLLQDLGLPAIALHSQMPQKARLRSIERFTLASKAASILIATDVAARGLDIPSVQLVIHYHTPRTADMYVHRSGRTARAEKSGSSILLCAPEEVVPVRRLIAKIHAPKPGEEGKNHFISTLDLDRRVVARLKPRLALAKKLADSTIAKEKRSHEDNWLRTAAEDLGVEYDSEEFAANEGSTKGRGMGRKKKLKESSQLTKSDMAALRAELKGLLSQRINVGVSESYLTSGGIDMEDLLKGGRGEFIGKVEPLDFD